MALDRETVEYVAKLAGVAITEQEAELMKVQLGEILEYVAQLSEVSTKGVPPTSHVHGVVNAFREDIAKESLPREEVMKNAPDFIMGSFRVPRII